MRKPSPFPPMPPAFRQHTLVKAAVVQEYMRLYGGELSPEMMRKMQDIVGDHDLHDRVWEFSHTNNLDPYSFTEARYAAATGFNPTSDAEFASLYRLASQ